MGRLGRVQLHFGAALVVAGFVTGTLGTDRTPVNCSRVCESFSTAEHGQEELR